MFMGMIIAIYHFYCVQGRVAIPVNGSCYYLGEKLLGDCGKYRIEHITNLFTLLIIVCLLTLLYKNGVLNTYGI